MNILTRKISIHAPPRGATVPRHAGRIHPRQFQFTPLREGRLQGAVSDGVASVFQFTPLREGRLTFYEFPRRESYFNSRPSARGDAVEMSSIVSDKISIHAPPRGATYQRRWNPAIRAISIHAPPRGATRKSGGYIAGQEISIHAPPRGATELSEKAGISKPFQFTPLREGRQYGILPVSVYEKFQFTPLREGRHPAAGRAAGAEGNFNSRPSARGDGVRRPARAGAGYFNSRPSARGDTTTEHTFCGPTYFNSRPSARGDQKHVRAVLDGEISIHAPPRGATEQFPFTNFHEEISIHAPPRGATKRQFQQKLEILFQFTPLREGRRVRLACVVAGVFISIHAPPRGATR